MGFLICNKCDGSYELQPGESIDDFDLDCECGGKLKFHNSINNDYSDDLKPKIESKSVEKSYAEQRSSQYNNIIIIGAILGLIGLLGILISYLSVLILALGVRLLLYGYNKKENWNKGIRGEQSVANYLNQLPDYYFIFNDVNFPGSYGNLDHVIIGPNGIFVIETKNYKGFYIVNDKDWYYKNGGHTTKARSQPGKQVLTNSMSLRKFFIENNINMEGIWIDSIVTLINNNFKITKKPRHYNVLFPSTITKFIQNSNKRIDNNIIKEIVLLIEPYNKKKSHIDYDPNKVHKNSFLPVLPGFGWKKF